MTEYSGFEESLQGEWGSGRKGERGKGRKREREKERKREREDFETMGL